MGMFRVALCQMRVCDDKDKNLSKALGMIRAAKAGRADIAVLPEMFLCPYDSKVFHEYAEEIPFGLSARVLAAVAKEQGIFLFAGSMPELKENKIYNTAVVFNQTGELVGMHRKMHLFDIDAPGEIVFRESDSLSAGSSITVIATPFIKAGVEICYDMRFPELSRLIALEGAGMIIVPAAFNMVTGPAHWEILIRTRSLDNQVYVCACAPARDNNASYVSFANSMVADPWGRIISRAGTDEEIIYADIDTNRIEEVRKKLPLLKHLRSDIYEVKHLNGNHK